MITLGIETSGREGSVALLRDGVLQGERDLSREGRRHARTLVAEIRDLLTDSGVQPRDVGAVAVSMGPGSFTGLRVGVTCAKTWAYATGANVVAVDTFLAVALQSKTESNEITVISDAQRGELFVGRFQRITNKPWERSAEIEIISTAAWLESLLPDTVVTGPAVVSLCDRLRRRSRCESKELIHPAAASIAQLGERGALSGQADDLWTLEPVYLRKSAAEEKAELPAV